LTSDVVSLAGPHELAELARSIHVATIDLDKDIVNERAVAFADQHAR
jgi:esterase/lipase